ncbi:MAG TPA: DNA polymerase/3'-5' exonuclease PolX [Bacteroidetes bacterium]|nr:DNA polymerase/3'-5' exonuclease PolX [Bacteroidota bacterium]
MDKKAIAEILDEMGTLLELQGANPFKSRAFHNASRAVEGLTSDIAGLVESGGIREIDGIGEKIALVISDLVQQGESKDYDELRKGIPDGVLEMLRVQGLGPKKVKVLYEKLKIKSLAELEAAAKSDKLSAVEGFGEKTQENILKGIQALRARGEKTIYPKAVSAAERVFKDVITRKEVIRGEIAGSLRRKKEVIGDIDIVVSAKESARSALMDAFTSHFDVETVIAKGDTKSSVVLKAGINCDMRIVDDSEYPFTLNYFTGSKEHNIEMRSRAKKYGWSLNEYGFSELGTEEKRGKAKRIVRCKDEPDIYKALELDYIPPELRENTGEIEAAEEEGLPRLVEYNDIRGTFHCHTKYSDGVNTLEEMADGARKLGWEYLGIGDHSKVAAYAGGLSEEKVKRQFKEIDELNARLKGFRLFKGTECDILPNGELDWPDKVLSSFEYVVVSIHSSFKMTEAEMTKRIIKALKTKYVTMLGHPTGRLLLSRDAYPLDMIQVINAAADYGKIIEINAHPLRLDLDWRLCKYAAEKGVMIAINPDAHNIEGLDDVRFGVGTARKGWLEKKDILNTKPLSGVLKYFNIH